MQQLGVGPAALHKHKMTEDDLAVAFRAMDGSDMRQRAAELGSAIAREDGVSNALDFIEARLARREPVSPSASIAG